jgi:hypothetical protein
VPNDPMVAVAVAAVAVLFVCQFPTASRCAILQCLMDARSFRGFDCTPDYKCREVIVNGRYRGDCEDVSFAETGRNRVRGS